MTDVAVSTPITEAYLSALEATGRPIGDAAKPPGQANLYPYGVLYVGTVLIQGSLVEPNEDGLHRVQVTSVGITRASVEYLRDQIRAVLLDVSVDIDGYAVVWTELVNSQPVVREEEVKPVVFSGVDVVNVFVTPTTGS